ncbi:MAG: sulfatase [Prolixibacteraceae bacterium]
MTLQKLTSLTVLLMGILICSFPSVSNAAGNKPVNIVLMVSDDHGKDALGCYGNPVIQTPALDRLAAEGIRFNNAYCTSASCTASRSVILSGIYNHANGLYGHEHSYHHFRAFDHLQTLPVLLSKGGYVTARAGKYHVAPEEVFPFDVTLKDAGRNNVQMSENCRTFIEEAEQPFFLYYCTHDPHRSGQTVKGPHSPNAFGNISGGHPGCKEQEYAPGEVLVPPYLPDSPETRAELAQYYQSVTRVDRGIERLMQILKDNDKYDNTLIIYISDNGMAFPGAKTTVYEPGIQLPCIIRLPGGENSSNVRNSFISWADLTPTLLDVAGIGYEPGDFHGRSFKTVLTDGDDDSWNEVYASHTFHEITMYYPMRVVRKDNYKLIFNIAYGLEYPNASDLWSSATWQGQLEANSPFFGKRKIEDYLHRDRFELYNLEDDPDEVINLAGDPKYAGILKELQEKLKAFQERTDDPWKVKWEHE